MQVRYNHGGEEVITDGHVIRKIDVKNLVSSFSDAACDSNLPLLFVF